MGKVKKVKLNHFRLLPAREVIGSRPGGNKLKVFIFELTLESTDCIMCIKFPSTYASLAPAISVTRRTE